MSKLVQIIKDSAVIILIGLSALALFFIAKALGITPSGIARWLRKFTGKTATPEVAEKKSEEKKVESVNTDEMEYKKSSKKTIQKIDDLLKELE